MVVGRLKQTKPAPHRIIRQMMSDRLVMTEAKPARKGLLPSLPAHRAQQTGMNAFELNNLPAGPSHRRQRRGVNNSPVSRFRSYHALREDETRANIWAQNERNRRADGRRKIRNRSTGSKGTGRAKLATDKKEARHQ